MSSGSNLLSINRATLGPDGIPVASTPCGSSAYPALCATTELAVLDPEPRRARVWLVPRAAFSTREGWQIFGHETVESGYDRAFSAFAPNDGGYDTPHWLFDGGVHDAVRADGGYLLLATESAPVFGDAQVDLRTLDPQFNTVSSHPLGVFARCSFAMPSDGGVEALCTDTAQIVRHVTSSGTTLHTWSGGNAAKVAGRSALLFPAMGAFDEITVRLLNLDTGEEYPIASRASRPLPNILADPDGGLIVTWHSRDGGSFADWAGDAGMPDDGTLHVARICRP